MQQLQIPPLAEGEIYIGCLGDAAGNVNHVILLPGDNDDATLEEQMAWAKSIGGDLPSSIELAMIYVNTTGKLEEDLYWSSTSGCPTPTSGIQWWYQSFADGHQDSFLPEVRLRAIAVRRIPIQVNTPAQQGEAE